MRKLTFNQKAVLEIDNTDEDTETFTGGSTIEAIVVDEDAETISFMWEHLLFNDVPKLFFLDFED